MSYILQPYLRSIQKLTFLATAAVELVCLPLAYGQQAYCWDPCTVNCQPRVGPRLCPPERILTYYDCCSSGCCQYIKWTNLLFLVIIIFMLLAGCGCCFFFLFTDARHRMFAKQNQERQQHQEEAAPSIHRTRVSRANLHRKLSTVV